MLVLSLSKDDFNSFTLDNKSFNTTFASCVVGTVGFEIVVVLVVDVSVVVDVVWVVVGISNFKSYVLTLKSLFIPWYLDVP